MSEWSAQKAATALRLIQKRGQVITLSKPAAQNAAGDRGAPAPVAEAPGVFMPGKGEGADRILLAATAPVPSSGLVATIPDGPNAGDYTVEEARLIAPDGGLIYSELEVSR